MNIKLNISNLNFSIPSAPMEPFIRQIKKLTSDYEKLAKRAGTSSEKFERSKARLVGILERQENILSGLKEKIDIRVLALLLSTNYSQKITINSDVLKKIDSIRLEPSLLFIEGLYDYFLKYYDKIESKEIIQAWLFEAKSKRGKISARDKLILKGNGPKNIVTGVISSQRDFDDFIKLIGLESYQSGRFINLAQYIYYLEHLKALKVNQNSHILNEVQKPTVYEAPYDENFQLGHKILEILIDRAPENEIAESWQNVIMAIAGDPRIPQSHPKYLKWWSRIDSHLRQKVIGWLSKLDLKLFLEALENFSKKPGNYDLERMFPSRKHFMEGLLEKKLVNVTRLFLSDEAIRFLKSNYSKEHLPDFSRITGDKSIIYLKVQNSHMIEGSHSCRLWIYEKLDPSASVFNYNKKLFSYEDLTSSMNRAMIRRGIQEIAAITHTPTNFTWQKKAIDAFRKINVPISPKDVLLPNDYKKYKILHGA